MKPELVALSYHGAHGASYYKTVCSNCGAVFSTYVWSFHGCGKKCPNCGQVYGIADVGKPEVVKHEGKWVFKVSKWLFDHNGIKIGETTK